MLEVTNTIVGVLEAYGYINTDKSLYRYSTAFTAVFSISRVVLDLCGSNPLSMVRGYIVSR